MESIRFADGIYRNVEIAGFLEHLPVKDFKPYEDTEGLQIAAYGDWIAFNKDGIRWFVYTRYEKTDPNKVFKLATVGATQLGPFEKPPAFIRQLTQQEMLDALLHVMREFNKTMIHVADQIGFIKPGGSIPYFQADTEDMIDKLRLADYRLIKDSIEVYRSTASIEQQLPKETE